ncbi:MAG: tRNA pseudouridine(38-40) synthase TruA [Alphaproteobacteria bacterium]
MRLKLHLQYLGTGLYGWQRQEGKGNTTGLELPTVEGHLISAWANLTGEIAPDFQAAGRTDAGVHALGQVVHIDTLWPHAATPIKVLDGLNHFLPSTIRVVRVAQVEDSFHARFAGHQRHYRYILSTTRVMRPDWFGRAGHDRRPLDIARMAEALTHLPLGEHDFSGFRDAECQSQTPMCNLTHRSLVEAGEGFVHLYFSANHFLHHMVRNMVGTLVECALVADSTRQPRPVADMARVLENRDRRHAGPTFGPEGLYFLGVDYPPHAEAHAVGTALDVSTL